VGPVDSLSCLSDLAGRWVVIRHGGRSLDVWRVRYQGDDEAVARTTFKGIAIRQGGLRLLAPDGRIVDSQWAPRLRTRW